MGYYSALKMKEILTHATTWMNPKDIMLSQSQIDKYCMLYEVSRAVKLIKRKVGWWLPGRA